MRTCKAVDGSALAIDIAKLPKMPRLGGSKDLSKVLEIVLPIAATLILVVGTAVLLLLRRHLRYAELREDFFFETHRRSMRHFIELAKKESSYTCPIGPETHHQAATRQAKPYKTPHRPTPRRQPKAPFLKNTI
jgi:hypothetical protein